MLQFVEVKVKKLHPDAKIPLVANENAAGFDFYSIEDYTLKPEETHAFKTGIALEVPQGKCTQIWDRSGLGVKGISKFAGLIDSDYRGEYLIVLHNSTKEDFTIKKGDRIAQGLLVDHYTPKFKEVQELSKTERGEAGFHSTGKN
jgi:dUTP pyrophosphatase